MKAELSKIIIFHFFAGQATPLQVKLIQEWVSEPANAEQYYEWLEAWEGEHPQYIADTQQGLEQYLHRLHGSESISRPVPQRVPANRHRHWYACAAAIALLLVLSLYLGKNMIQYEEFKTAYGEVKTLVLADGSRVSLNANSWLRVPRFGFGSETRNVFLEGEAEFSVVHTVDHKKFMVHTPDNLEVEVVGTEFIVYSRHRGSKVVLNHGKVLLRSRGDTTRKPLAIKPGDVVTIHNGIFNVLEKQNVQTHAAWKEHRFVFDHTPLEEIAYQVKENFGITMQIPDTLLARRELTGTYEAASIDDLMHVLARVLDVEVKQKGNQIEVNAR